MDKKGKLLDVVIIVLTIAVTVLLICRCYTGFNGSTKEVFYIN